MTSPTDAPPTNAQRIERHISIDTDDSRIMAVLDQQLGLSHRKLKQLLHNGAVWLQNATGTRRVRRARKLLGQGDVLHVYYDEKIQSQKPPQAQLIADEQTYSIWNKPSGMYIEGSKWGDHCTLYRWAEMHLQPERPAFIVHRLDRAASGLIILAHKKSMARRFAAMFEARQVYKKYRAEVEGIVAGLELPFEIRQPIENKPAVSRIISIEPNQGLQTSLLEVEIETGRKHQIRQHLANLGYPIVGDRLFKAKDQSRDLQLSAIELAFECPLSGEKKHYYLDRA